MKIISPIVTISSSPAMAPMMAGITTLFPDSRLVGDGVDVGVVTVETTMKIMVIQSTYFKFTL